MVAVREGVHGWASEHRHGARRLPGRGAARPRRDGRRLPRPRPRARARRRAEAARARSWPTTSRSASGSCASRGWPPRSTTRTSSRSTTPARSTGSCTSRCATSRARDLKQLLREGPLEPARADRASSGRSRTRSTPPTRAGSCTATSSPRTCCSTSASTPTWPTSASRRRLGEPGAALGGGPVAGHDRLRRPGADPRRGGRRPRRRLLARLPALRVPDRRAAVSRAASDAAHALRAPRGGAARRCPGSSEVLPKALAKEPDERYATCARARRGRPRGARDRRAEAQPLAARRRRGRASR